MYMWKMNVEISIIVEGNIPKYLMIWLILYQSESSPYSVPRVGGVLRPGRQTDPQDAEGSSGTSEGSASACCPVGSPRVLMGKPMGKHSLP